ncbi:MAG: outer membrane beta-barrel protein [Bacteroidales bacterium]|nr:outer membrane beta-barrel protein [Bacteroidales bacterium]
MTVDRSKIDEIFRNRLKDHEVIPPYEVWEDVVVHLAERRRIRKSKKMYLQIAASLIILVAAGSLFLTSSETLFNSGVQSQNRIEKQSSRNIVEEPPSQPLHADASEKEPPEKESGGSPPVDDQKSQDAGRDFPSDGNTNALASLSPETSENIDELLEKKEPLMSGVSSNNGAGEEPVFAGIYAVDAFTDGFASSGEASVAADVPNTTHFSLKATMAPVMSYRRLQNNASRAEYNTSESELFSYSGGVNFGYKLTERLSVHSGFYYSQMGQTVSKIRLGSDDFAQYGEEIFVRLKNSLGEVEVKPGKLISAKPPESIQNIVNGNRLLKFSYKLDASVVQRFEYVKVPLMVEYTVIDKKIDVNLVGGLNSNFLVNEGVYLKNQQGDTRLIGNTANIRQFNYSGSLGLGLEYNIATQVNMYFEPQMDYFLHSINYSETKTYPYSFGVLTGLSITF